MESSLEGEIQQKVEAEGIKFFHLRGGVDWERLRGLNKMMPRLAVRVILKKVSNDPALSPEQKADIVATAKGSDFVSEENLLPVIKFVKSAYQQIRGVIIIFALVAVFKR